MKKSASQKIPSEPGHDLIQSFILCFYYLNQEAKRENLSFIADITREAISAIEQRQQYNESSVVHNIYGHSLYHALDFLTKFAALSKDKQQALATLLDRSSSDERFRRALEALERQVQ